MQRVALVDKTKIITMFVILSRNLSNLTLSCGVVSSVGRVSIIMLQKVSARKGFCAEDWEGWCYTLGIKKVEDLVNQSLPLM